MLKYGVPDHLKLDPLRTEYLLLKVSFLGVKWPNKTTGIKLACLYMACLYIWEKGYHAWIIMYLSWDLLWSTIQRIIPYKWPKCFAIILFRWYKLIKTHILFYFVFVFNLYSRTISIYLYSLYFIVILLLYWGDCV